MQINPLMRQGRSQSLFSWVDFSKKIYIYDYNILNFFIKNRVRSQTEAALQRSPTSLYITYCVRLELPKDLGIQ